MVDEGNLVGATAKTLLTEVVNDTQVYVYFDVSERELLTLSRLYPRRREDTERNVRDIPVFMQLADEKDFPHKGKMDFAEPRIDPSTGTLQARAIYDNKDGILLSGLFARVRVPYLTEDALLVPEVGVGISQVGRYVLVVNKDNVVEQRIVETGPLKGQMRVIRKGLKKDDRVIIKGIQRARPGRKVRPKEATGAEETPGEKPAESPGNQAASTEKSKSEKPKDEPAKQAPSKK
jgi:RND family efflux transporter MFP subunit